MDNKPLRKCGKCGKEANTEAELDLFVKDTRRAKYGRLNWCKVCWNKAKRAKYVKKPQWTRVAKQQDPAHIKLVKYANRVALKLSLANACEICGKALVYSTRGKANLIKHHDDYTKPEQIRSLCRRCHYYVHQRNTEIKLGESMESNQRRTQEGHLGYY